MSTAEHKSAGRVALGLVLAAACVALVPPRIPADDKPLSETTTKYFRELRRRGLFKLAESYCLERLSHEGLSSAERTDLTLELSRTLAEHAEVVGSSEQDELWSRSEGALAELLKQDPDNPRRLLLEVQRALLPATIGHSRRLLAELDPYDASARKRATESLQTAVEKLRSAEAAITARQRKTPASRPAASGALRPFELRPLLGNVRYRLGGALLDLAHLQRAGSSDRIALSMEAQKVLKTVGESADDVELVWQARLAFVEASRLLEDHAKTVRELDALEKLGPPDEFADRLLAERVRVLIASKDFRNAASLLAERERADPPASAELQALRIERAIAEWRAANPSSEAKVPQPLLAALEEQAARLRRDAGGYWAFRSEQLIRQMQDAQQYGPALAALAGKAQAAFNAGEAAQAVELYGQAAAQARRAGRADLAFQFGFTQASIDIKSQSWDRAAAELRELAGTFPKNPKTPQAHLLAAYALGKAYDEQPTSARRDEYVHVLEEHRSQFTESPTLSEATWMLAELEERRGRSEQALALYQQIPPAHQRSTAAHLAIARCFEQILDSFRERGESPGAWEEQARQAIQKMLPAARDTGPLTELLQAELAVRLARILLQTTPPQYDPADRLLSRVAAGLVPRETAPADVEPTETDAKAARLRARARQLQVISLAGQGKFPQARKLLDQLSAASPAELLRILDGLVPLQSDVRGDPYRELGELQLAAALKLDAHRDGLSKADQRRLDECLARGYFAVGKPNRGFEIYDRLVQKSPRDRELLLAYAGLLARCGSSECLNQAVSVWRRLEALHEPGSRDWFPARYELCKALLAAGQSAEARKLLQVTRLVFPKPEEESLQKKFADLEAKSQAASPAKLK